MKCSICNAENPPDATSCHRCGFSFSLGQPTWPEFPTIEVPDLGDAIQWPEPPEIETSPAPAEPEPLPPEDDVLTVGVEAEPVPPLLGAGGDYPSDDELARSHIARGFEAIRAGLIDQAQWEFEQARDLADDMDIVRMAQAQLDELHRPAAQTAQRQIQPVEELIQTLRAPTKRAAAQPRGPGRPMDWGSTIRIGLNAGLLGGLFAGYSALACLGLLLVPVSGFVAGWLIARKADESDQSSGALHALVAGGAAGLAGWLGQVIGYLIWGASTTSRADPSTLTVIACLSGAFYVPSSMTLGALGWRMRTPKR